MDIKIKQFKDSSSNWFVNFAHYYLNENNELLWASGESDIVEYRTSIEAYIKRNKKSFKEREVSPYINPKEYLEIINFGKYSGKSVQEVFDQDKGYLKWLLKNFDFAGKEKLKEEIINILK